MNKKLALFLCVFLQFPIYGIIIQGDPASTPGTNTFSFPLTDAQYNQLNGMMWTFNAIAVGGTSAPFAISSIKDGTVQAIAQTSTQATITTTGTPPIVSTGANPLYTDYMSLASLWTPSSSNGAALPICVGAADITSLYALSNIIMADDISSMYKFTATGNILNLSGLASSLYYIADSTTPGVPEQIGFLSQATYPTGSISYLQQANAPLTFNGSSSFLTGSSPVTVNASTPTTCLLNNNLYVGLNVTGVVGSGGAAAFLTNLSAGGALTAQALLPLNGDDTHTVLSTRNTGQLAIQALQVMNTSTGLTYLIVLENYSGASGQDVYAVPIVTNGVAANYGVVAQYTNATAATDIAITSDPVTNMILKKGFANPITIPTILQIDPAGPNQNSLTVGTGLGTILAATGYYNISVTGDCVYIATNVGTYFSKALFDQYGAIAAWTPWQITHAATWPAGLSQATCAIDGNTAKGWFSRSLLGGTSIVQRTEWNNTSDPLQNAQAALSGNISGNLVQNIFDLPSSLVAFSQPILGSPLSGMIYTGKNQVIALTTGSNLGLGGQYYPVNPATIAAITDASAVGHVVAFEIGYDAGTSLSWAFASGQNGIAVSPTNSAGSRGGSSPADVATGGIAQMFQNPFALIAQLPYVKKLQATTNNITRTYLYALNSQGLYKILLSGANFYTPTILTPTPVFLASSLGPNVAFTDFIASTNNNSANIQCIIGTTQGLYIGQDDGTGSLTQVQLPSIQSVQRLIPQADLATGANNLYVVAGDFANDQTEIVRFYLNNFGQGPVAASLIPIQDQTYVGLNKPFVTMYNFQNTFWWQGSCGLFGMSGRLGSLNPIVKILKGGVTGNMSSNQSIWMYYLSTLGIPGIAGSTYLTTTLQDSAYGALQLGGGDFGLQVLS